MGDVRGTAFKGKSLPRAVHNSALSCSYAKARCTLCLIGTSSTFLCQRAAVDSVPSKTDLLVGLFRQTVRKRGLNPNVRASSSLGFRPLFLARFTGAITRCVIGLPPACVAALAEAPTIAPPQRRTLPRSFCRSKMADQTRPVPKRQSAERSSASVRSTPKKKPEKIGASLLASVFSGSFSIQTAAPATQPTSNAKNAGSLVLS